MHFRFRMLALVALGLCSAPILALAQTPQAVTFDAHARVTLRHVDEKLGNPMIAYRAMGSPRYPTLAQIAALTRASTLPPPEELGLDWGQVDPHAWGE